MSRYIDIEPILEWCGDPEVCEPYGINSVELERKLYDAPSIDIVRCGECKRANYEWSGVRCGLSDALMGADGFCSIGERREL